MGSITRSFANLITANGPSAVADGSVTAGDISGNINFKNIIINGDMSIAQRGTSFTGLGDTDSQYTLDRFKWTEEGSSGTAEFTITQSTDVPTGQGFATSLKLDCTTADTSVDSGNIIYIEQRVEGQNLQYLKYGTSSAESTTLSFWVKSNKTGTYTVNALGDIGGSGKLYSQAYTISSADTWEKKTLTFIGDTALAINNNTSSGLQFMWNLLAGTDKSSGSVQTWGSNTQANRAPGQVNLADNTSNEFYITGVQLEAGTSASDFEFLPRDITYKRCCRYFQTTGSKVEMLVSYGRVGDTGGLRAGPLFYPEGEMRATPTLSYDDNSGNASKANIRNNTAGTDSSNINLRAFDQNNKNVELFGTYNESTGLTSQGHVGTGIFFNLTMAAEL
jgi:hypothetical protein